MMSKIAIAGGGGVAKGSIFAGLQSMGVLGTSTCFIYATFICPRSK